jgi:hypothetical protein
VRAQIIAAMFNSLGLNYSRESVVGGVPFTGRFALLRPNPTSPQVLTDREGLPLGLHPRGSPKFYSPRIAIGAGFFAHNPDHTRAAHLRGRTEQRIDRWAGVVLTRASGQVKMPGPNDQLMRGGAR